MALHRLTSITMGVPNVTETSAYYGDFGLVPDADGWFTTRTGGRQLRIVAAPTRRLVNLHVGVDDTDDLARATGNLQRLGLNVQHGSGWIRAADRATGTVAYLEIGDGAGGPICGTDPAGPVLHVQSEALEIASGAGQVVRIVHTDVQVDQSAGRRRHDAQLAAAGACGEPAVCVGDEAEVPVISGRFGHVRDAHRDGRQSVQSHAELPPLSATSAL